MEKMPAADVESGTEVSSHRLWCFQVGPDPLRIMVEEQT